jgi:hypothetical protein
LNLLEGGVLDFLHGDWLQAWRPEFHFRQE